VEKDIFSSLAERTSKDPMIISPFYNYKYKFMFNSVVERTSKDPMIITIINMEHAKFDLVVPGVL